MFPTKVVLHGAGQILFDLNWASRAGYARTDHELASSQFLCAVSTMTRLL